MINFNARDVVMNEVVVEDFIGEKGKYLYEDEKKKRRVIGKCWIPNIGPHIGHLIGYL